MISSAIEKLLFFILCYISLIFWRLVIPEQDITYFLKYQYLAASFILAYIIFIIYIKIRNRYVLKRIGNYLIENKFYDCKNYIDRCISNQKNLYWLKIQKSILMAVSGEISDFHSYLNELSNDKRMSKCKDKYLLNNFELLFSFLVQNNNALIVTPNQSTFLNKTLTMINLYQSQNNMLQKVAFEVYNSPYNICKCIAAMIIALEYKHREDDINYNLYYEKSMKYAPSSEILYCINRFCNNDNQ